MAYRKYCKALNLLVISILHSILKYVTDLPASGGKVTSSRTLAARPSKFDGQMLRTPNTSGIHWSVDGDSGMAKISLSACITASFAFLGVFQKNKQSPVEIRSKFQGSYLHNLSLQLKNIDK